MEGLWIGRPFDKLRANGGGQPRGLPLWVGVQEPLDLGAVRHGVPRSAPGDDEGAGGGCKAKGALDRLSLGEGNGEGAGETVSGGHGIEGFDLKGGDVSGALFGCVNDATLAQFDEGRPGAS